MKGTSTRYSVSSGANSYWSRAASTARSKTPRGRALMIVTATTLPARLTEARARHAELAAALAALDSVAGDLAPEAAQVAEGEAADLRKRIDRLERKIGKLGRKRRS